MKVQCRGYVGTLIYFSRDTRLRTLSGMMKDCYSIEIEVNKTDKVCLKNVKDNEIEVLRDVDFQETPES